MRCRQRTADRIGRGVSSAYARHYHDEAENPVGMIKIIKGRMLTAAIPIPDDCKLLAWFDVVWAYQQTGDEAIKLLDQHRLLAKSEYARLSGTLAA